MTALLFALGEKFPDLPRSVILGASYLRKLPEFRGVERDPQFGYDARFRDETHRYYHGTADNDEHAVIIAACRWQKINFSVG